MLAEREKRYDIDFVFFFQAEDGIRDYKVTGVQTCALPISRPAAISIESTTPAPPERSRAVHPEADARPGRRAPLRTRVQETSGTRRSIAKSDRKSVV